jgi:hypothetical protein
LDFFAGGGGGAAGRNNPNISSALGEHCARMEKRQKGCIPAWSSLFRVEFIAPGVRGTTRVQPFCFQAAVAHSCLVNQQVFLCAVKWGHWMVKD